MEPEGSLRHSQVPAICPYPEPGRSSSARLPYVALLSLDGINAGLLRVALLFHLLLPQHIHRIFVSSTNHSTCCTLISAHDEKYDG